MLEPGLGDFEVVPTGGQGGKLIQIAQIISNTGRLNYEHARIYVGNGQIVEAEPGGARVAPISIGDSGMWSTGLVNLTSNERTLIASAAREYAERHVGYSVADYFAIAAYKFKMGVIVPGLKRFVESSGHMICSQLVDQCYQDAGVHLFNDDRWTGYVTPGDLADLLAPKR
jgi:uncharacterized protein YycO